MDKPAKNLAELQAEIKSAVAKLDLDKDQVELEQLQAQMNQPDFWVDQVKAAEVSQREARLHVKVETWQSLEREVDELNELAKLGDASLSGEIEQRASVIEAKLAELSQELKFTGPYDERDVILNIYAGAGGTDAQDWAQMLARMYTRWAEANGAKAELLDQSAGEEAGLKSATIKITGGDHLFGKLSGEHGVHRLVRKSPFNAAGSRETSFARVDVLPVIDQPKELELDDKDLKIDVFRSGGAGGQSVNTTDSAVRVTHLPTGISVSIQNERSQLQNKETALAILRSKLAQLQLEQHAKDLSEIKGPTQSAEWGNQIRSYVLDDKLIKHSRTSYESHDPQKVLDGDLDPLIDAWLNRYPGYKVTLNSGAWSVFPNENNYSDYPARLLSGIYGITSNRGKFEKITTENTQSIEEVR